MKSFPLLALMGIILFAGIAPVSAIFYDYNQTGHPEFWMVNNTIYTMSRTVTSQATQDAWCVGTNGAGWARGTGGYGVSACTVGHVGNATVGIVNTSGCSNIKNADYTAATFNSSSYQIVWEFIGCTKAGDPLSPKQHQVQNWERVNEFSPDFIVNFTGTPVNGSAPLQVSFSSVNTSYMTDVSWSFGDGNVTVSNANPITHLYVNPGTYTVWLGYTNTFGISKYVQKNNYITVGAPNATSTTYAVARDLYTGFAINGAQVDMYDVENSSWKNTTTTNGEASITTLLGHTINIYGSATGYSDDNLIGVPEVEGGYYSLLLTPTNLTTYNTTPGNLTLVVTVQDLQIPHQTLQGAEVTAAWGSQYASGTTNAAGNTFFTVPNNTAIHLSAFKSGYASGSSTHITGTANGGSTMETAIVYIGTDYVTPIPSVSWTGTGTIPPTVDPYPCIGDGSAQDTANCQRKQGSMAADLISYGPDLVKFFIMLTFIGGLLLITGKR